MVRQSQCRFVPNRNFKDAGTVHRDFVSNFPFEKNLSLYCFLLCPLGKGSPSHPWRRGSALPLFPVTSEGDTKRPGMALPEVVRVLRVGKGFSIGDGRAHLRKHGGRFARPLLYLVSMTVRGRAEVLMQINDPTTLHWAAVGPMLRSVPFVCASFNLYDQPAREAVSFALHRAETEAQGGQCWVKVAVRE